MSAKRISLQFSYALKGPKKCTKLGMSCLCLSFEKGRMALLQVCESNYLVVSRVKSLVIYVIMFEFPCAL